MMVEPKYVRNGSSIKNLETGNIEKFPSINKAKLKSRLLQKGNLGNGILTVKKKGGVPKNSPYRLIFKVRKDK